MSVCELFVKEQRHMGLAYWGGAIVEERQCTACDGRETGGREMIALDPCMVPGCELLIPLLCSGLDSMDAYIALRFTYIKKEKKISWFKR
jgi:hypothetical protein